MSDNGQVKAIVRSNILDVPADGNCLFACIYHVTRPENLCITDAVRRELDKLTNTMKVTKIDDMDSASQKIRVFVVHLLNKNGNHNKMFANFLAIDEENVNRIIKQSEELKVDGTVTQEHPSQTLKRLAQKKDFAEFVKVYANKCLADASRTFYPDHTEFEIIKDALDKTGVSLIRLPLNTRDLSPLQNNTVETRVFIDCAVLNLSNEKRDHVAVVTFGGMHYKYVQFRYSDGTLKTVVPRMDALFFFEVCKEYMRRSHG
jgi:hypothetical protein